MSLVIALLLRLPRLRIRELAKELACSVERQILAIFFFRPSSLVLTLLPWLPWLHISKLTKELACPVKCQILAIFLIEVVAGVVLRVTRIDAPRFGTVVAGHTRGDKLALMLTKVPTGCMRVRVLEHAVVVVWIAASVVSLRINGILLLVVAALRIRALEHASEVIL